MPKNRLRKNLIKYGLLLGAPLTIVNVLYPIFVGQVGTYIFAAVWSGLTATFLWLAWVAFWDETVTARTLHFVTGIALTAMALFTALLWTIGSYLTGDPSMLVSPVVGGYITLGTLGGIMLLTTPNPDGSVSRVRLWVMWGTLALGAALGLGSWFLGWEQGLAPAPV